MLNKAMLVCGNQGARVTLYLTKTSDSNEQASAITLVKYAGASEVLKVEFGYYTSKLKLDYKGENMIWEVTQGSTTTFVFPKHVSVTEPAPGLWDIRGLRPGDVLSMDVRS